MYYLDYNNKIQFVNISLFHSKKEFNSFLWKQMYNVNISPYPKQDPSKLILTAYHTSNT